MFLSAVFPRFLLVLDSIGIMGGLGGKVGCAFEDSEDAVFG